jgi:hypothetical protein
MASNFNNLKSNQIIELSNTDDDDNSNSHDSDYLVALQLQIEFEQLEFDKSKINTNEEDDDDVIIFSFDTKETTKSIKNKSDPIVDPQWDLIDPCPDIRSMFMDFNGKYFDNKLGSCLVEWSKRMTICAGLFYLREGGIIRLSEPLLKYRSRKELIETLLHEMIHAYLYLTRNFKVI